MTEREKTLVEVRFRLYEEMNTLILMRDDYIYAESSGWYLQGKVVRKMPPEAAKMHSKDLTEMIGGVKNSISIVSEMMEENVTWK